ncbi:hypothetical protein [Herbidospora mongoliensis]|uniref:hypothetical protein n=1 Tax=Herbidospora mongoliensis TaxID=688067 RepID=UPI000A748492|nr:hypothetical protein [Herbidospora mongoliensis]
MSVIDDNLGQLFWSAAQNDAPPVAQPKAKSSCCGPKPTAEAAVTSEMAPAAKSSCCGPKPAADTAAETVPVPTAKSSCCN